MSWTNINIKEINPAQLDLVAPGSYTFALNSGAKYNERGAILASATIESDGEFRGKKMLFSYPDPESVSQEGKVQSWSSVAFKRMEVALGQDVEEGEDPVAYLNRVAGGKFAAGVTVKDDASGTKRSNIQLLNVKPAA
jgi:hypothetical protein